MAISGRAKQFGTMKVRWVSRLLKMKSLFLLRATHYKLRHTLIIPEHLSIYSGTAILAIKCYLGVMLVALWE